MTTPGATEQCTGAGKGNQGCGPSLAASSIESTGEVGDRTSTGSAHDSAPALVARSFYEPVNHVVTDRCMLFFSAVEATCMKMDLNREAVLLRRVQACTYFKGGIWTYKPMAAAIYLHVRSQAFIAALIVANFALNIIEKQIDPDKILHTDFWRCSEWFFTIAFAIELLLNMYGFWFRPFWSSGWNVFDLIVVIAGLLEVLNVGIPSILGLMRTLRAFRIFRLFKRAKELRLIVRSLFHALPGVVNAFLIMAIVMSIYAMLAVEFYREVGIMTPGSLEEDANSSAPGITAARVAEAGGLAVADECIGVFITRRGKCYGDEYFGDFSRALFTLFQIQSGESWAEAVTRLALFQRPDEELGDWKVVTQIKTTLFFYSYVVVSSVVLMNIVTAVLLDKMSAIDEQKEEEVKTEGKEEALGELEEEERASTQTEHKIGANQAGSSAPETGSSQQALAAGASVPSYTTMRLPELDDHVPGPWLVTHETSVPAVRCLGGAKALGATAGLDTDISNGTHLKLMPRPAQPPYASTGPGVPTGGATGSTTLEQKDLDPSAMGCEACCAVELTTVRQELASARGQLAVLSSQLQALVALMQDEKAAARGNLL